MKERGLDSPYWLNEPHADGQTTPISGSIDGVPWYTAMRAGHVSKTELGWTHLVGFAVGIHADPNAQGTPFISLIRTKGVPINSSIIDRAWRQAENALENFETTRRTRRAIEDELSLSKNPQMMKRSHSEELAIALSIYELVAAAGRRDSTRMIAAVTGWSESKSEKLIAKQRAAGKVGPSRRGRPTPKKKGAKK